VIASMLRDGKPWYGLIVDGVHCHPYPTGGGVVSARTAMIHTSAGDGAVGWVAQGW